VDYEQLTYDAHGRLTARWGRAFVRLIVAIGRGF